MNMNELDLAEIANWPYLYKLIFILLVVGGLMAGFYYCILEEQVNHLSQIERKEVRLKKEYVKKANIASTLEFYKEQMNDVELLLAGVVNKLPNKKELAILLDDISFVGTHNGLQFKSINWGLKKQGEMSEEVPISIKVIGSYAQLGQFSADIAALSRIVILENLQLKLVNYTKDEPNSDLLILNIIAKTYRYKDHK